MGGKSSTSSTTSQVQETNTTQLGLADTEGVAAIAGGDVEVNLQTTDLGAVQGSFDFAGELANDAFNFANDAGGQAAEISERAIETSQAALATATTGGRSDLAKIDSKTIAIVAAAAAAAFVIPKLVKGSN